MDESQALKKYNFFDLTTCRETKARRPVIFDTAANSNESKLSLPTTTQGIIGFSDIWYILGLITTKDTNHILMVYSKGKVLTTLKAHEINYGIWGIDTKEMKVVITLGEDLIDGTLMVVIKIWDPEYLMDGKYESIHKPKVIFFDRIISIRNVMSVSVSNTLSTIALGFDDAGVLIVSSGDKSLHESVKNVYFYLKPEIGFSAPVTNIFVSNLSEKKKTGYVFCASENGFYCRVFGNKVNKFIPINKEIKVLPNGMDCIEDNIVILDTNTLELLKYKGLDRVTTFKLNEMGVSLVMMLESSIHRKRNTIHFFRLNSKDNTSIRY